MPSQHPVSVTETQPCQLPTRDQDATSIVVDGYGVTISVDRGRLRIDDGLGQERRSLLLSRGTCKINRVLILAVTGSISLSALRWCEGLGISVLALNRDNSVTMRAGPPGIDDARLRRAQALATSNVTGLAITRYLLGQKIRGQRNLMNEHNSRVDTLCSMIERASSISACLALESEVASIYWQQWSTIPLQWKSPECEIPEHWRTVGVRASLRSRSNRNATTPANAILNYCYRLAEIETIIAIHRIGLDPGLGIFHTDQVNRASMALDCIEAIRPNVDAYVYQLLTYRMLQRADFYEQPDGACRVRPTLSHELASTLPVWRDAIAPVVETVANALRPPDALGHRAAPTPLTRANARATQTAMKARRNQ